MIENRELTMDDYLAILRRRWKVLLIPTVLAPLLGFGISFAFAPKYTSQSQVLVEDQKVPEGYVKPVVTTDLGQRLTQLLQRALSADELRKLVTKLDLARGNDVDQTIDRIRKGVNLEAVQAVAPQSWGQGRLPGFILSYTASNPPEAQRVCAELTNTIIKENFDDLEQVSKDTTDFLARQVDDQKHKLDELDSKLADFKKSYIGQLPGDEDQNLKILMAMNSQLDADTQALNRAQQDKAYADSVLAQQLAAWKSSQSSSNPATLQKQITDLQAQLITLKARYTDDYPEVVKTKGDIRELQKKLDEIDAAASNSTGVTGEKPNLSEPPEIQQLRAQQHQYQGLIAALTREQQRLQQQIRIYQGRVALSPAVEEQYKQLTRDYETAQKIYNDLLAKKSQSEMQTAMEREQQGEQMTTLRPADLPETPSFPSRLLFAGGGLASGLGLGLVIVLWLEMRDKLVRTEGDVSEVLGFPVLSQVPWVGIEDAARNGHGNNGGGKPKPVKDENPSEVEV
jgi:polysaccharide chain length determinant protein (PEP-CTERM system associated)